MIPLKSLLAMLLLTVPAFAQELDTTQGLTKQAIRCALHADLAASNERNSKLKTQWIKQKDALVLFASRTGTSSAQLDAWISEFADEIVAVEGAEYEALVRKSSETCQAFLTAHGGEISEINSRPATSKNE